MDACGGEQFKSLSLPKERSLLVKWTTSKLTERNLRVHLEKPHIQVGGSVDLEDPVAHSVALTAWPRPAPLVADRAGYIVIRCLDNQARGRRKDTASPRLYESTGSGVCLPPIRLDDAEWNVDRNSAGVGVHRQDLGNRRGQACSCEATIVERNGEPRSTGGVYANNPQSTLTPVFLQTAEILGLSWLRTLPCASVPE